MNTLPTLPIELRIAILVECASLHDLGNLVTSCTAYHQAYLSSRATILDPVLRREVRPWMEDLLLLVGSGTLIATVKAASQRESVIALLDRYRHGALADWHDTGPKSKFAPDIFSLEQCLSLVQAKRMVDWTCAHLCQQYGSKLNSGTREPIDPSSTEKIRLSRAICRHEAFCVLMPPASQSKIWDAETATGVFLRIFPVWEIEELACIYEALRHEYGYILIEIAKHYCSLHPTAKVDGWEKEEGYFDVFEPWDFRPSSDCFDRGREALASLGPSRLYDMYRTRCLKVVNDAHEEGFDHDHEWRLTPGYVLPGLLEDEYQADGDFYHIFPAEEHISWRRCGERQHKPDKQPGPGMAWFSPERDMNRGDWHEMSGRARPFEHFELRYWGYTVWDKERLEVLGLPSRYATRASNAQFDSQSWMTHEEECWMQAKAAPPSDRWDMVLFTRRVLESYPWRTLIDGGPPLDEARKAGSTGKMLRDTKAGFRLERWAGQLEGKQITLHATSKPGGIGP